MRRAVSALPAAVLAAGLSILPQNAVALSDAKTGFGVSPSAPYVAASATHPAQDILFGITSTTGKPAPAGTSKHLCGAGFKASDANTKLTQKQINGMVDDQEWRKSARAAISFMMTIDSEKEIELGDARGVEYVTTPRMGPDHENMSMLMTIVEVPQGRVTFTCAATKAEFQPALDSLRAVRSTITLPK